MDWRRPSVARIIVGGAAALSLSFAGPPLHVTHDAGGLQVIPALEWGPSAAAQARPGNGNGQGDPGNGNGNGQGDPGNGNNVRDGLPAPGHGGGNSSDGRGGGERTRDPQSEMGPSLHPSGRDRTEEPGGSGTQGNARSDPDGDFNYGVDQPSGSGGIYTGDRDGNNGCGNDQDFEDDNRGNCGGLRLGDVTPPGGGYDDDDTPIDVTPPGGGYDDDDNPGANVPGGSGGGMGDVPDFNNRSGGAADSPSSGGMSLGAAEGDTLFFAPSPAFSGGGTMSAAGAAVAAAPVAQPAQPVRTVTRSAPAPVAVAGNTTSSAVPAAVPGATAATLPSAGTGPVEGAAGYAWSLFFLAASGLAALGAFGARRSQASTRSISR